MFLMNSPDKPDTILTERAIATSWLLIDTFDRWVGEIWKEYQLCGSEILGFERQKILIMTYRRILVELLCWSLHCLYQEILQEHIKKTNLLLSSEPDLERIEQFKILLQEDLTRHLNPYIADLREIQVASYHPFRLEAGGPLSIPKILAMYEQCSSGFLARELFTERLAFAIDPYLIISSRRLAQARIKQVYDMAQSIVEQVFSYKAPLQVIKPRVETQTAALAVMQEDKAVSTPYGRTWRFANAC